MLAAQSRQLRHLAPHVTGKIDRALSPAGQIHSGIPVLLKPRLRLQQAGRETVHPQRVVAALDRLNYATLQIRIRAARMAGVQPGEIPHRNRQARLPVKILRWARDRRRRSHRDPLRARPGRGHGDRQRERGLPDKTAPRNLHARAAGIEREPARFGECGDATRRAPAVRPRPLGH